MFDYSTEPTGCNNDFSQEIRPSFVLIKLALCSLTQIAVYIDLWNLPYLA